MTKGDLDYFVMLFQSTKRMDGESLENWDEDGRVRQATEQLIRKFCSDLKISSEIDPEIQRQIMMHLKVAVFRLKNKIKIKNPLLEDIKYSHSFMYELTERLFKGQEEMLGVVFPDAEIAYTTMYFEVLFQENFSLNLSPEVVLVCGGGTATAVLLKQRISKYFPELRSEKSAGSAMWRRKLKETGPTLSSAQFR